MDKSWINNCRMALEKAEEELNKAIYLEDCGSNAGIRKMNANKAEWLKYTIYLAKLGFDEVQRDAEVATANTSESTMSKTLFKRVLEFFQSIKNTKF